MRWMRISVLGLVMLSCHSGGTTRRAPSAALQGSESHVVHRFVPAAPPALQELHSIALPEFAPSPLTPFAERLHRLVAAALGGAELPRELPLAPYEPSDQLVGGSIAKEELPKLRWLGFWADYTVVVDGAPGHEPLQLDTGAFVWHGGWFVFQLCLDRGRTSGQELPDWLRGLADVSQEVISRSRDRRLSEMLPGSGFRAYLGELFGTAGAERSWNDAFGHATLHDDGVKSVESGLGTSRGIRGYRLHTVQFVARGSGTLVYEIQVKPVQVGDSMVLDTHPLVSILRFDLER